MSLTTDFKRKLQVFIASKLGRSVQLGVTVHSIRVADDGALYVTLRPFMAGEDGSSVVSIPQSTDLRIGDNLIIDLSIPYVIKIDS